MVRLCAFVTLLLTVLWTRVEAQTCSGCGDSCVCSEPVDVYFAVDTTGSTKTKNIYAQEMAFMKDVVGKLELGEDKVKTAGLSFAVKAKKHWGFTDAAATDYQEICDKIDNFPPPKGDTRTDRAINIIYRDLKEGMRACSVLVMITDGGSDNKQKTIAKATQLNTLNIKICLLSIGYINQNRIDEVNVLLGNNGQEMRNQDDWTDLLSLVPEMLDCICSCGKTTTTTPPTTTTELPPPEPPKPTPPPPPPARTPPPSEGCDQVDVVFVIDTTGSTRTDNIYDGEMEFLREVVYELPLGASQVMTSGISFALKAITQWRFTELASTDADEIDMLIDEFPPPKGDTRTDRALRAARISLREASGRGCSVVVLVTDGGSDNKAKTQLQANALHNVGVKVCMVSVGEMNANRITEIGILTGANGQEFRAETSDLLDLVPGVLDCICNCEPPTTTPLVMPTVPGETPPPPPPPPPPPTTPETHPCECFIRGDPVVVTCFNEIMLLDESTLGLQLAADSWSFDCEFQVYINNEEVDTNLIIPTEVVIDTIDTSISLTGSGSTLPPGDYPDMGLTVSTTDEGYIRVTFTECGAYVEFRRVGNASSVNIHLPHEVLIDVDSGVCVE